MTRTCSAGTCGAWLRPRVSFVLSALLALTAVGVAPVVARAAIPAQTRGQQPPTTNNPPPTSNASIVGKVTDSHGGAIAGAIVVLIGDTGADRQTTTGADGSYAFRALPRGRYQVAVSMPGFATFRSEPVYAAPSASIR